MRPRDVLVLACRAVRAFRACAQYALGALTTRLALLEGRVERLRRPWRHVVAARAALQPEDGAVDGPVGPRHQRIEAVVAVARQPGRAVLAGVISAVSHNAEVARVTHTRPPAALSDGPLRRGLGLAPQAHDQVRRPRRLPVRIGWTRHARIRAHCCLVHARRARRALGAGLVCALLALAARQTLLECRVERLRRPWRNVVAARAALQPEDGAVDDPVGADDLRLQPRIAVAGQPRRACLAFVLGEVLSDETVKAGAACARAPGALAVALR